MTSHATCRPTDADLLPERLAAAVGDPLGYQQAVGALRRYSLATVTADAISLHRLVQAVVRHTLDQEQAKAWAATVVSLVQAAFPAEAEDVVAWPVAGRLLPHALVATGHASTLGADPSGSAVLLHAAGRYLWGHAEHNQAKALHDRALEVHKTQLGPDHLDTA
jgi:hypothetical protein